MATAALRRAVSALTRTPDPADADLVRQFAASRSEAAFAALVRRHGPLVLGVCRRVVPDSHLADDAFQAAFVVLARRAGGIDPTRPLAPWLYGVAHRVALRARAMLGKRRRRETLAAAVPEVPHSSSGFDDAAAILDEEIAKLTPAARDAVVLCELQGMSRRAAATQLGVAEGTLSSRLAAARKTLAAKLRARGVVLSAALSSAVVSPQLASAAVAAGVGASLSSVVVSLADRASAMTLFNKLKLTGVAVLFLVLSAGGVRPWGAGETSAAPVPKAKDRGRIWLHDLKANELVGYTPAGEEAERLKLPAGQTFCGVTPDGANILYSAMAEGAGKTTYHLRPFGEGTAGTDLKIDVSTLHSVVGWSRDGTRFIRVRHDDPLRPAVGVNFPVIGYEVVDVKAKTVTPVHTPPNTYVLGWTPDEKQFVGNRVAMSKDDPRGVCVSSVVPESEAWREKVSFLDLGGVSPLSLAPGGDEKTLLAGGWKLADDKPYHAVYRFDPEAEQLTELFHAAGQNITQAVPSPDGRRFAAVWIDTGTPADEPSVRRLTVADADGTGAETVTLRGVNTDAGLLRLLGWFPAQKIKAPAPKAKVPEPLAAVWQGDTVRVLTLDGTERYNLALDAWKGRGGWVRLSPDGTRLAVRVQDKADNRLVVVTLGKDKPDLDVELDGVGGGLFWAADGSAVSTGTGEDLVTVDATTGRTTAGKRPDGVRALGVLADGRYLADRNGGNGDWRAGFVDATLTTFEPLKLKAEPADMHFDMAAGVSADGSTVALARVLLDGQGPFKQTVLTLVDVKTGEETAPLSAPGLAFGADRLALSADGDLATVAYLQPLAAPNGGPAPRRFTLCVYRRSTGKLEELSRDLTGVHAVDAWSPHPKAGPVREPIKASAPKATDGLIWTYERVGRLTAFAPDGTEMKTVELPDRTAFLGFTLDGAKMLFAANKGQPPEKGETDGLTLHLGPIDGNGTGTDTGLSCRANDQFVWSPDDKQVVRVRNEKASTGNRTKEQQPEYSHLLYDLAAKRKRSSTCPPPTASGRGRPTARRGR